MLSPSRNCCCQIKDVSLFPTDHFNQTYPPQGSSDCKLNPQENSGDCMKENPDEHPECDIDEDCDEHQICVDSVDGRKCVCREGFHVTDSAICGETVFLFCYYFIELHIWVS